MLRAELARERVALQTATLEAIEARGEKEHAMKIALSALKQQQAPSVHRRRR